MSTASDLLFQKFEAVKSNIDREAVFKELGKNATSIAAVTDDELTFFFKMNRVESQTLFMTPVESPRNLIMNENGFLFFSISSGQYALRGPLKPSQDGLICFSMSNELRRLQRRTNFRVSTIGTKTLKVKIPEFNSKIKNVQFEVQDISAGGLTIYVSDAKILNLQFGASFICELSHPSRSVENLKASIRHIDQVENGQKLGIEFLNLSKDQMQDLLALSLQMHRESKSSF